MPFDADIIQVVCAIVRDDDGRVLAAKRAPGRSLPGKWELPGGKIDASEIPEDALRREMLEELAVEITVLGFFRSVDFGYEFGTIRLFSYWASIEHGTPTGLEHEEIRWMSPSEFDTLEWAPADLPVVKELGELSTESDFGTGV